MAIIASAKSSGANPVSEGVHAAVCIWIVDLGDQYSELYDKMQRKVMLTWEVSDETVEVDGEQKPRVISKEYTMSLSEKATLRAHLEAWRGKKFSDQELKGFDLGNVLGASCQLQVLHNDKGYANIGSIMALPKGMPKIVPATDTIYFDLTDPGCLAILDKLPSWIADKVRQSSTYRELMKANVDVSQTQQELDDEDGDLPF